MSFGSHRISYPMDRAWQGAQVAVLHYYCTFETKSKWSIQSCVSCQCWFRFAVARSRAVAPKAAMRLAQVARTRCSMACVAPIRNTRRRHIDGILCSGLCMKLRKPSEHTSAPGFDRKTLWQQVHFRSLLSTCTYP